MEWMQVLAQHRLRVVAITLFLAASGLPLPCSLVLLLAGAAAHQTLDLRLLFPLAVMSAVLGDVRSSLAGATPVVAVGRYVPLHPQPRRLHLFFIRLLLPARLKGRCSSRSGSRACPQMAAPIAGSLNMRYWRFLSLDLTGVALYVGTWLTFGYVFSRFLASIVTWLHTIGHAVLILVAILVAGYGLSVLFFLDTCRKYNKIQKVSAETLRIRLSEADPTKLRIIADVRSHNYYDPGMQRIKNSIRVEPTRLKEELEALREFMAPECEIYPLLLLHPRHHLQARGAHARAGELARPRSSRVPEGLDRAGGELELVPAPTSSAAPLE